jgi:hypothetical protein
VILWWSIDELLNVKLFHFKQTSDEDVEGIEKIILEKLKSVDTKKTPPSVF